MTKDDILRMGREAGMHDPMVFIFAYERFAKLVYALAAEREREECAKVCEALRFTGSGPSPEAQRQRQLCADAIRNLKETSCAS